MKKKIINESHLSSEGVRKLNILIPAVIGLVGVLMGGLLTYFSSQILWSSQKTFYISESVMQKRFDLIDRLTKLNGQRPGINELWYDHKKDIPDNTALSERLGEYGGEYFSVVFQSSFYFGEKTNAAARALGESAGPWWEKPQEQYDTLLSSMRDEMLSDIKSTVQGF